MIKKYYIVNLELDNKILKNFIALLINLVKNTHISIGFINYVHCLIYQPRHKDIIKNRSINIKQILQHG